jgi:hypothetical protein
MFHGISIGGQVRPRLLVADDHVIFAETLRVFLEKSYAVQGIVSDGMAMVEEAIRLEARLDCCGYWNASPEWVGRGPATQGARSKNEVRLLDDARRF